ncbi:MAG TPA: hypothetical protein VFA03_05600 [Acetobacteraceae bacterium]|nr:hypothetical protein [Acetobacteraceae bacterium]
MSISASTVAQGFHATLHRSGAQQTPPMQRRQEFERHLHAAQQAQGSATAGAKSGAGQVLSSDMLKSVQTLG